MRVQEIFAVLSDLGLVRSQIEFSRVWLGRSPRYYSSLLARQQQPSVGTLTGLLFRLRNILAYARETEAKDALFSLIEGLDKHLTVRAVVGRFSGTLVSQPTPNGEGSNQ